MRVQPHGRQPLHLPLVAADEDADAELRLEPVRPRRRCHGHARGPQQRVRHAARARIRRRVPPFRDALPRRPAPARGPRERRVHADVPAGHASAPRLLQGPAPERRDVPVALGLRGLSLGRRREGSRRGVLGEPRTEGHRTGRHRLRAPPRGRSLWRPVCLRDARLPDVGGARNRVDEPMGQGSRRWHGGAIARRLPRRQRHRRLSVACGEGRRQARQARSRAADQGRPVERAAGVQPVGGPPAAAAVTGARSPGRVPVGRFRRGPSGLPAAGSALGRERRFQQHGHVRPIARAARHAVPQRQLVGHDGAERPGTSVAARAEGHRRPEPPRQSR